MSKTDTTVTLTLPRAIVTRTQTGKTSMQSGTGETLRFADALTDAQSAAIAGGAFDASAAVALADDAESRSSAAALVFWRMREGDLPCPIDNDGKRLSQVAHWNALCGRDLAPSQATRALGAGRIAAAIPEVRSLPVDTLYGVSVEAKRESKRAVETGAAASTEDAMRDTLQRVASAAVSVSAEGKTGPAAKTALVAAVNPAAAETVEAKTEAKNARERGERAAAAAVKGDVVGLAKTAAPIIEREPDAFAIALLERIDAKTAAHFASVLAVKASERLNG